MDRLLMGIEALFIVGAVLLIISVVVAMWFIHGDHGWNSHWMFAVGAAWIIGLFAALFAVATIGALGGFA